MALRRLVRCGPGVGAGPRRPGRPSFASTRAAPESRDAIEQDTDRQRADNRPRTRADRPLVHDGPRAGPRRRGHRAHPLAVIAMAPAPASARARYPSARGGIARGLLSPRAADGLHLQPHASRRAPTARAMCQQHVTTVAVRIPRRPSTSAENCAFSRVESEQRSRTMAAPGGTPRRNELARPSRRPPLRRPSAGRRSRRPRSARRPAAGKCARPTRRGAPRAPAARRPSPSSRTRHPRTTMAAGRAGRRKGRVQRASREPKSGRSRTREPRTRTRNTLLRADEVRSLAVAPHGRRERQETMQITFWGVRGSIPTPGPEHRAVRRQHELRRGPRRQGDPHLRRRHRAAPARQEAPAEMPFEAQMFFSHVHWDHIQGFPFFEPAFVPGNKIHLYGGNNVSRTLEETLAGQMDHPSFPVHLDGDGREDDVPRPRRGRGHRDRRRRRAARRPCHQRPRQPPERRLRLPRRARAARSSSTRPTRSTTRDASTRSSSKLARGARRARLRRAVHAGGVRRRKKGWGHSTFEEGCEHRQGGGRGAARPVPPRSDAERRRRAREGARARKAVFPNTIAATKASRSTSEDVASARRADDDAGPTGPPIPAGFPRIELPLEGSRKTCASRR